MRIYRRTRKLRHKQHALSGRFRSSCSRQRGENKAPSDTCVYGNISTRSFQRHYVSCVRVHLFCWDKIGLEIHSRRCVTLSVVRTVLQLLQKQMVLQLILGKKPPHCSLKGGFQTRIRMAPSATSTSKDGLAWMGVECHFYDEDARGHLSKTAWAGLEWMPFEDEEARDLHIACRARKGAFVRRSSLPPVEKEAPTRYHM